MLGFGDGDVAFTLSSHGTDDIRLKSIIRLSGVCPQLPSTMTLPKHSSVSDAQLLWL